MAKLTKVQTDVIVEEILSANKQALKDFENTSLFKKTIKSLYKEDKYTKSRVLDIYYKSRLNKISKLQEEIDDLENKNYEDVRKQYELLGLPEATSWNRIKDDENITDLIKKECYNRLGIDVPNKKDILHKVIMNSSKDLPEILEIISNSFKEQLNGRK